MTQEYIDKFITIPEENYTRIRLLSPSVKKSYHYQNNKKIKCTKDSEENCLLCQQYSKSFKNPLVDFGLKPIERWYYNAIVRGKEEQGPQIFSVGRSVQEIILNKVMDIKKVELTTYQLWMCRITGWWYYLISYFYKPKFKSQPSVFDLNEGYDFILKKKMRSIRDREFADYSESGFVENPSPAGSPEQIKNWKLNNLDFDLEEKENNE